MPKLNIENRSGELEISWKWKNKTTWFFVFFTTFWNAIVFVFVGTILSDGGGLLGFLPISLHAAIGLFLIYMTVARFLNQTTITVNRRHVKIAQGPVPWFGDKVVDSHELEQLYIAKSGSESSSSQTIELFALRAKVKKGKDITLVNSIQGKEKALEIEKSMEDHLGIIDEPVLHPANPLEKLVKKHFPGVELPTTVVNDGKEPNPNGNDESDIPPARTFLNDLSDPVSIGIGMELDLGNAPVKLVAMTQLDWDNGTTDRSGIVEGGEEDAHVYSEDNGARGRQYFEERALSPKEFLRLGLGNPDQLPSSFANGDEKFYQREALNGYAYPENGKANTVQQWIYFTTSSQVRFRVIYEGGELAVFIQEPIALKALA